MDKQPDIDEEKVERLMKETTIEVDGKTQPLGQIFKDIQAGHEELDQYKSGAMVLSEALDERRMQAKQSGDEMLVDLLDDFKDSAYGIFLRIERGDLELVGERDGKHSGFFSE